MRGWIIATIGGLILTALALPAALTWYVLYTEAGVNLLARELPYRLAGIEVAISGIHGSLAQGLRIEHLRIHHRRANLDFSDIQLDLELAPALLQTLHARNLEIGNLGIEVLRRTTPYVPTQLYFLPHWLEVRIDALHVAHGTLLLPSGQQFSAADLRTHGTVNARTAHFFDAAMRYDDSVLTSRQGVLHATLTLGVSADLGVAYQARGRLHLEETRSEAGAAR